MIFNMSGGGGNSLNFKVVGGTSAPSNPKENTIWVNTDTAIHAWDFSATEPHRRSNNKNLIVYPYVWTQTGSQSGITYTVNSDGTISANGTASANAYCHVSNTGIEKGEIILEAGTYTLSGCSGGGSNYALNIAYSHDNWATKLQKKVASGSTTFTIDKPAKARFYISIYSGTTVSNLVFKPQLEKGSSATSFVKGDATGQVWICTDTSSAVAINTLKKNNITVYPISAKQYVRGSWVKKIAKSYQNDALVDLYALLFDNGNQFTSLTNGWAIRSSGGLTCTIGNTLLFTITGGSSRAGSIYTKSTIDVSNFSTLEVDVNISSAASDNNGFCVGLASGAGIQSTSELNRYVAKTSSKTVGQQTISLDISSMTDSYYVVFFADVTSASVSSVRLIV